ncbi:MAG: hypothetical protein M5Z89_14090, partial [Olivibacter sp.]|nr:hypothetical protein [Olivibacter sp. UJ_SKK_5.1]
ILLSLFYKSVNIYTMENSKVYNILSPDGIYISFDWFDSPELAWQFYAEWKCGFERLGYYSSNVARIPLERLDEFMRLVDIDRP